MKPFTDITILLDRSGSMSSIASAMKEGFNAFLLEHRKTPSTRVTLVQFDSSVTTSVTTTTTGTFAPWAVSSANSLLQLDAVYENRPITEVPALHLNPRGGTPLIDALCTTIDATGQRLRRLPETERPAGVLFVVITDGEENSSTLYRREDVKRRIEHQEGAYQWQFLFLGANQDAIHEAHTYGINAQHAMTYNSTLGSTRALFNNFAFKSHAFTASVSAGNNTATSAPLLNYNQADRTEVLDESEK